MSRTKTIILFLLVTLVFGTAFPAVKAGLSFFPPLLFVAVRNYLAAGLLLSYTGLTTTYRLPRSRRDWLAIFSGGTFLIGGIGFGFVGQQFISSGVASIIFSLSPIVTALLAWVLLPDERLGGRDYLGIGLGFAGVAIIVRPDPAALLDPTVVGKALVLIAVIVVSLGAVLVRRSRSGMPVPALTGWAMILGATIQFVFAMAIGEALASVRITLLSIGILLYLGIFAGAIGLVLFLVLIGTIGATKANLVTYLTPVVAIVVGLLFLGERVQPVSLIGFSVIIAGFAVLESRTIAGELARYRGMFR